MHHDIRGTLTPRQVKQHLAHAFTVPAGTTELALDFSYTPERTPQGLNALHLTLFDPAGFRGAGHRRGTVKNGVVHHRVVVRAATATPGYLAGPLPAGAWSVVIDTHMILPGEPVQYQITIDASSAPVPEPPPQPAPLAPVERGRGWYRGDLHAHTVHSDASWQIDELLAAAAAFDLDFVTLSDHNTVSGLAEWKRHAPPNLLAIGGIELTTFFGHALALGVQHWIDWRTEPGARSMPQIAAEVEAAGGVFIIAHPASVGDPVCTGCDWTYRDMLPGSARVVEIWNGGVWDNDESNNEDALALWYRWLNAGHRIVATAGTDAHGPAPAGVRPGFNVVYADAFSEAGILHAVLAGHLYLSDGPQLEMTGRASGGASAMMGEQLPAGAVRIATRWAGCAADDTVLLIVDGRHRAHHSANESGEHAWDVPAGGRWCVVELRAATGQLRAITNPIYLGEGKRDE